MPVPVLDITYVKEKVCQYIINHPYSFEGWTLGKKALVTVRSLVGLRKSSKLALAVG